MTRRAKNRIKWAAADLFLLFAGTVAAHIARAAGAVPDEYFTYTVNVTTVIALCFFVTILVVEIVSVFKISDSTWHTVFIALFITCYYLAGDDFVAMLAGAGLKLDTRLFAVIDFALFEAATCSLVSFWNYTYKTGLNRMHVSLLGSGGVLALALFILLDPLGLEWIAFVTWAAALFAVLGAVYRRIYRAGKEDLAFSVVELMLYTLLGERLARAVCSAMGISATGYAAFYSVPAIAVFILVYISFAMRTDREALKASEYKLHYEQIRTRALREQIKPHFVFNVLAAIQSLYRRSPDDGDRATTLLSRHLRTNIEAADTDLVPFERELDNVQVYVDLENMRLEKKFNVIFDIDFTDFMLPILSLQPYVENAIKHSRVNEREDGFILISSVADGDDVLLTVADNGVGFDPGTIPDSSCGLRNSQERFLLLTGAKPEINSAPGKGTRVSIKLKIYPPPSVPGEKKDGYGTRRETGDRDETGRRLS